MPEKAMRVFDQSARQIDDNLKHFRAVRDQAARPQQEHLRLWLLTWATRPAEVDSDYYDSVLVVAADREAAKRTHPLSNDPGQIGADGWTVSDSWAEAPQDVAAKLLGDAAPGVEPGVLMASFVSGA